MKLLHELKSAGLIQPPEFLVDNTHYLTIMGSYAYGVSGDTSDMDLYGIAVPPKDVIFPHLAGVIPGFGFQGQRFEMWQQHHIRAEKQEYDFAVYSIVKFFQLAMENNPNILDSLFTPERCVIHCTPLAKHVRDNRRLFLHKGAYHKFMGYAHSQLKKIRTKQAEGKRVELIQRFGYDVKFAYHLIRLCDEIEQILVTGDLELGRNKGEMKAIREGEYTLEELETKFELKQATVERLYNESNVLPYGPDEKAVKGLLLECLEMHYGRLDNGAIVREDRTQELVNDMRQLLERYR